MIGLIKIEELLFNKIDTFFSSHTELDQSTINGLKNVIQKNTEPKIIIERNKTKAIKLSKQITKNHFVSLEQRGKMWK